MVGETPTFIYTQPLGHRRRSIIMNLVYNLLHSPDIVNELLVALPSRNHHRFSDQAVSSHMNNALETGV